MNISFLKWWAKSNGGRVGFWLAVSALAVTVASASVLAVPIPATSASTSDVLVSLALLWTPMLLLGASFGISLVALVQRHGSRALALCGMALTGFVGVIFALFLWGLSQ